MKIDDVQVYDTVTFDVHNDGVEMEQKLWPRHCVIDSWGSEFHQDLKVSQLFFLSKVFFFNFNPTAQRREKSTRSCFL